jgi:hypothetical protein
VRPDLHGLPTTVLAVLASACGARTGLESAADASTTTEASAGLPCGSEVDAGTPPTCNSWRLAGADRIVSQADSPGMTSDFTAAILGGNDVLASWLWGARAITTWSARVLGFDGAPLGDIRVYLSDLNGAGFNVGGISLAADGCAFGGLLEGSDCSFCMLEDGDAGSCTTTVANSHCSGLGPSGDGFSFVGTALDTSLGSQLVTLGADGSLSGAMPLPVPSMAEVGPRFVLHDQSFLLTTLLPGDSGEPALGVQHFSAAGDALAPPLVITGSSASLAYLAETHDGVLAAWEAVGGGHPPGIYVAPLDRDGKPTASAQLVAATIDAPLYGIGLAPTPGGDALLTWVFLVGGSSFELQVIALAPDGTPRGAPTTIGTYQSMGAPHAVVSPDGTKALLLISGSLSSGPDAVHVVPLACVR